MPKFRLLRLDTGNEFTLDCHEDLLAARLIGFKKPRPVEIGQRFRFKSKLDGSTYIARLVNLRVKVIPSVLATWGRGFRSDAMGVNPEQRIDAMKADEGQGLRGVDYDAKTGEAIFSSRGAYKRYCEAHGFFDRNAGYSGAKKRDPREREIRGLPQIAEPDKNVGNEPILLNEQGEILSIPAGFQMNTG